jgi:hypothetical protein
VPSDVYTGKILVERHLALHYWDLRRRSVSGRCGRLVQVDFLVPCTPVPNVVTSQENFAQPQAYIKNRILHQKK